MVLLVRLLAQGHGALLAALLAVAAPEHVLEALEGAGLGPARRKQAGGAGVQRHALHGLHGHLVHVQAELHAGQRVGPLLNAGLQAFR